MKTTFFYSSLVLLVLVAFIHTGCSATSKEVQKKQVASSNSTYDSFELYGQKIPFDDFLRHNYVLTLTPSYTFFPSDKKVFIYSTSMHKITYNSKAHPQYHMDFKKPVIINSIKYNTADFEYTSQDLSNSFGMGIAKIVFLPLYLVKLATDDDSVPSEPSVAKLGIYKPDHKKKHSFNGDSYRFKPYQKNNIYVSKPFQNTEVNEVLITVNEIWAPNGIQRANPTNWNPGNIEIELVDVSDMFSIVSYTLSTRKNQELNEDLITAIVKNDTELYKKLKRNKKDYYVPYVSYLHLPDDIDIAYARDNKYKVFQEKIYRNSKGKHVHWKRESDLKLMAEQDAVSINIKKLDIDEKKVNFSKKEDKEHKAKYIDFSDGL